MKIDEKPKVTQKGDQAPGKSGKDSKKAPPVEELSEEDRALSDELQLYVQRLQENDSKLYIPALEALRSQIKSSTSSMTAVPKPLKFLRNHYETLKNLYDKMPSPQLKSMLADVVSILAMTIPASDQNRTNGDSLKFRLLAQNFEEIGSWGHEYVRHLSAEIAWEMKQEKSKDASNGETKIHSPNDLLKLVEVILPYNMNHNAEAEACDLLIDIERTDLLAQYIDSEELCRKVCLYLRAVVPYVPDPENTNLLHVILNIFLKFKKHAHALRVAMQLHEPTLVQKIFDDASGDLAVQKQLAFMIARQQMPIDSEDSDLLEIASSTQLNNYFLTLGRELDIMEPKQPEDIYKTHLETNTRMYSSNLTSDSARANLASAFVNGFVNCGFGKDKLVTTDDGGRYIFKNKDSAMMSTTASMGLISLWDVDTGLAPIDKYFYSKEEYIKAGAMLACGIVNCGVRHECDPAKALLTEFINDSSNHVRIGAIMGLGLSYAGSNRDDLIQTILQVFQDPKSPADLVGVCAMAMGVISVGTANNDVTTAIIQYLIEKQDLDVKDYFQRFLLYALGMSVLGKQNNCEAIIEALGVISNKQFKEVAKLIVEICAYAATGNVLKIQQLLQFCAGNEEEEEKKETAKEEPAKAEVTKEATPSTTSATAAPASGTGTVSGSGTSSTGTTASSSNTKTSSSTKSSETSKMTKEKKATSIESEARISEAIATIGIGLISMVDDISCDMSIRMFGHLLRYGSPMVKRAVPLAMALTSVSNPRINILETLSKFSHDGDNEVACNAIFAMGLVGAGTNNARLAAMLRQLAQFHAKDQNCLFMVRIAQGLTVLGKSTLTLSPFHSDRQLVLPTAVAALLTTCLCLIDPKYTIIKAHYLLYSLVPAIQPRMLITFDEQLKPLQVTVRVGQAVDTVGQAGRPKTITGFQTHTTPVLLSIGERAELATEEYIALTPILEGFVILRKNPDYKA